MARKIIKGSRLPNRLVRQLIHFFALKIPAVRAAHELGIHRHSAERIYDLIRHAIVREREKETPLSGEVEIDESYFGGYRKGNRGRGATGKVAVFGLLKRKGMVYTRPVPDVSHAIPRLIIKQKVPEGSTIYSDSFRSYDGLLTDGYRHYRINHGKGQFARKRNHINGIESFWAFAKTKLRRYYGIRRSHFFLYLKEMEFRFNHRHENIEVIITKILRRGVKDLDGSQNIFTLFSILFGTWLFFSLTSFFVGGRPYFDDWKFYEYRVLIAGIAYILLGYAFSKNEQAPLQGFLYGFGILGFLGAALTLGGWEPNQNVFWELIYPVLSSVLCSLVSHQEQSVFDVWHALPYGIYSENHCRIFLKRFGVAFGARYRWACDDWCWLYVSLA